ncbi:hypothetical protein RhiXN_03754 [Rhizoctonia solani]|uniref:Uncharacterized protein n=1 Tax=Rhizoctonia solani TaxID=456999 RepID=A0A8H8NNH1_9AGAM|nr:uncharacterized protein RhiXN_03754 [Rhizoctonia solani]QRW15753.1 hypothetical protein RhiXN_03754 [Rhizoctonia solani]
MSATIQEPKSIGNFASGSGSKQNYPKIFVTRDLPNEDGLTVTVQDAGIRCIAANANAKDTLHPLRRAPNSILPLLIPEYLGYTRALCYPTECLSYMNTEGCPSSLLISKLRLIKPLKDRLGACWKAGFTRLPNADGFHRAVAVTSEDTFNNAGLVELEGVIASIRELTCHALPSPLPPSQNVTISTQGSSQTQLVLAISSHVLSASVTLPRTSNIANALGAARSSSEWVIPSTMLQDDTRTALVNRIKQEVQAGRTAQADAAFFRWVENEAELSTEGDRAGTLASATKAAAKIPFPNKEKDGPMFASGIVSALIWRGAAGQGMLRRPGGLYGALRQNREWPIMLSALQHVPDIPEDETVATIRDLLIPFHPEESSPPRLMNTPPLQNALAHVLASSARSKNFDVWELEGLQPEGWAGSKNGKSVGVSAGTGKKKVKGAGMIPALEHIINFTQALLDTHLITLLQHRPSHALLRSLSATLSPLPAHNDTLSTLTAPLAQFAAEDALERKSELDSSKGAQTWQTKEEWRKRRKARLAAEAVAIGDYRFEELVL